MRMGREPYWWNLEDSMKFPEEKHQLGSSWPIPMTVMWGGSQRVWGPDPWCNPTNPKTKSLLGCQCQPSSSILSHDNILSSPTFSFKGLPGPNSQQERAWACWFQRRGRRAAVLHETDYIQCRDVTWKNNWQLECRSFTGNQLQCRDVTWKVTGKYSAAATSNICNDMQ